MTIDRTKTVPSSGSGSHIGLPIWGAFLATSTLIAWGEQPAAPQEYQAFLESFALNRASSTSAAISEFPGTWILIPELPEIQRDELDEGFVLVDDLSEESRKALGAHAYSRLRRFLSYPSGWAGGEGQAPNTKSLSALDHFLRLSPKFATEPSVFLTRDGFFELMWETDTSKRIELVFGSEGVTYLLGDGEAEGTIPLVISKFEELLKSI